MYIPPHSTGVWKREKNVSKNNYYLPELIDKVIKKCKLRTLFLTRTGNNKICCDPLWNALLKSMEFMKLVSELWHKVCGTNTSMRSHSYEGTLGTLRWGRKMTIASIYKNKGNSVICLI